MTNNNQQELDWTESLDIIATYDNFDLTAYLSKKLLPSHDESVPEFSLEVYVRPFTQVQKEDVPINQCSITQRRITFNLSEDIYNKVKIDKYKCHSCKEVKPAEEDTNSYKRHRFIKKIVIKLQKGQELQTSNFEEYIQQVLEYIDGRRQKFEFNKRNQFDFIYLCDLFQLSDVKNTLMSYLSQNFDIQNVFEFLRLAAQDIENKESMRESYWIIVFIYLRKIGWDISESFKNEKTKNMLQNVNPYDYNFQKGFLVHEPTQKKIELSAFVPIALEEREVKNHYLAVNNMHNLNKVERTKSEQGLFSDYPHYYKLKVEGKAEVRMFGIRNSENGEFFITMQEGDHTQYGRGYVGVVIPNFLGTRFDIYDYGIESGYILKDLPKDFLPTRKKVGSIEYDTNFFAEKPRSFRITVCDYESGSETLNARKFENLAPKYNEQRGCYTLNFFGRVSKASARNFQLIETEGDDDEEIFLSHGKHMQNEFNLDFRAPFNQVLAFGISLSAIGKKRVVG